MGLFRAIKAHKSSGLGLDREQRKPTTQSALCTPQPSGYKEFRDPSISDPLCSFCLAGRDMHVFWPTKTHTDDFQAPKAHKNHFSFFHRNHFSSKLSCDINAFHASALFVYHFSLSSEKIVKIIVIITMQWKTRAVLGSTKAYFSYSYNRSNDFLNRT